VNDTFHLGRIAGIPIGLNWTWLLVFALFVWSLASELFPAANPGLGAGTYVAMAVASVLLFFGSLLLHELGHAVQARREGVAIDGITLWLFGGVARFRGMFPGPGAEFRIAIAGPLVTAALGGAFVGLHAAIPAVGAVDGVLAWLAYINFFLLAFNLLPALPLDGGRVFRAALWKIKGDFGWATTFASAVARGFGALMIAAGVVTFFVSGVVSGLWLAVVGWFLLGAAGSEARLVALSEALDGLLVADLMRRAPQTVQADETMSELVTEVTPRGSSPAYPVLAGDRPVGILPFGAILRTRASERSAVRARDRMLPIDEVATLRPTDSAFDAVLRLAEADAGTALVLDDGRVAGIVFLSDVEDALRHDGGRAVGRERRSSVVPLARVRNAWPAEGASGPSRDAA
jgi:Zn-dependent protease/CBS domain-containing protein